MQHEATTTTQPTGFALLDEGGCIALLDSEGIGHLGLTSGAMPVVTPVRYRLVGRSLVFPTGDGLKLNSARRHAVACLEIAGSDASTGADWSVLATGRLREVTDQSLIAASDAMSLLPWARPAAEHLVALDIELLSGTRSQAR